MATPGHCFDFECKRNICWFALKIVVSFQDPLPVQLQEVHNLIADWVRFGDPNSWILVCMFDVNVCVTCQELWMGGWSFTIMFLPVQLFVSVQCIWNLQVWYWAEFQHDSSHIFFSHLLFRFKRHFSHSHRNSQSGFHRHDQEVCSNLAKFVWPKQSFLFYVRVEMSFLVVIICTLVMRDAFICILLAGHSRKQLQSDWWTSNINTFYFMETFTLSGNVEEPEALLLRRKIWLSF